ncbi:hypothetical protein AAE478_005905 [Parahypoxylon ruwenzoriense]
MATPQRSRFRLEFRVVSDGLESARAQELSRAGAHAHGSRFARFPDLPPELRLKIWEYLIAPRIVAVECLDAEASSEDEEEGEDSDRDGETGGNHAVGVDIFKEPFWMKSGGLAAVERQPSTVPVLLLVNRETRALALSHYEPAFSWKVPHVLLHNSIPSPPPPPPPSLSRPACTHSSSLSPSLPTTTTSSWSQPRVWFNYALDAVYLRGELEPCDSYGFNSPTAYFLRREEARRVRRLAVAFASLRYGGAGSQHIFGALFHVVDRFARVGAEAGRVLVAVSPRDEWTNYLMGGEGPLVRGDLPTCSSAGAGTEAEGAAGQARKEEKVNIVQKIWRDWYRGSIVQSSLANVQFELVREDQLARHVAEPIKSATVKP